MPNLIKENAETTIWFVPATAAQAEDAAFECHNLAAGAGIQSAHHDRGVAAVSRLYEWRAFIQFAATPVLKETVDIYLKLSGTSASATAHPDNDDGTTALSVSAIAKLDNLVYIGSIVVDEAAINVEMSASGFVEISARGVNVVFWNASADITTNDVDENGFFLTPVPDEVQ